MKNFWSKKIAYYEDGRKKRIYFDEEYITFFQHKGVWQVFRYEDAVEVLSDYHHFSNSYMPEIPGNPLSANINQLDPPRHTVLRKILTKAFSPTLLKELVPWLNMLAQRLLKEQYDKKHFDFISTIANPFPSYTINQLLGIPGQNFIQVQDWVSIIVAKPDMSDPLGFMQKQQETFSEMINYFQKLLESKSSQPGSDLISALLFVEDDNQKLSKDEIIGTAIALMLAGNDTTSGLIGNAVQYLCENTDIQKSLWHQPELIPAFVQEILRMRSPVQSHCRKVVMDCEFRGNSLKKGDIMNVWIGSANLDEYKFTEADTFLLNRGKEQSHLSWGHGVHACIGAVLAQMEATIILQNMAQLKKNIVIIPETDLVMASSDIVATVEELPVQIE